MFSLSLLATLFFAGALTILLPCILPLIPIVLGVSITGRSRWRPLVTVLGMVLSFVLFTFLLQVVLSRFVTLADLIQTSTYYVLILFGICFLTQNRTVQILVAVLGGFLYYRDGWIVMTVAQTLGAIAVDVGGRIATKIQQLGSDVQQSARAGLGSESLITAFIVGLTLGLVWVPCAGPALGFALALVRDEPGLKALAALAAYGLGAGTPLIIVGYGGQAAVHSVRAIAKYSGRIKQFAGAILIVTALGLHYGWLMDLQVWITDNTMIGSWGSRLEEALFTPEASPSSVSSESSVSSVSSPSVPLVPSATSVTSSAMSLPTLPKITRAPEFTGLGPWHNSEPFTLASLKGKVVLIDFWTYSCINCIRTLPYLRGYWEKFQDKNFVLLGVHTPEFVFEKSERNVADAIKRHKLTYPTAQDNDFGTWSAFANRYWPAKYLIDADGYIRYTHFGEGAYEETDLAIQSLLKEIGETVAGPMIGGEESGLSGRSDGRRDRSPETYLGSRSWPAFQNSLGDPDDEVHTYGPEEPELNQYVLVGDWQMLDDERQVLRSSEGEIRYRALGSEVNLVLGLEEGTKPVMADVFIDGKKTKTITIDRQDLFVLYDGDYGEHEVTLKIHGKGVGGYAYTFGG